MTDEQIAERGAIVERLRKLHESITLNEGPTTVGECVKAGAVLALIEHSATTLLMIDQYFETADDIKAKRDRLLAAIAELKDLEGA